MRWYEKNPARLDEERSALISKYPLLSLEVRPKGYQVIDDRLLVGEEVVVEGLCQPDPTGEVTRVGYDIAIILPVDYPRRIPTLYCRDQGLPRDIDRHILSDGRACLCVVSEVRRYLKDNYRLVDFVERLVHPFLVGQYYFDFHGKWPWQDRSHRINGILEAYEELTGLNDLPTIRGFMEILSKERPVKGHWLCPCGSGKRLRDCHSSLYRELRESTAYVDVADDLRTLKEWERQHASEF
jgi:hypothetical protein